MWGGYKRPKGWVEMARKKHFLAPKIEIFLRLLKTFENWPISGKNQILV